MTQKAKAKGISKKPTTSIVLLPLEMHDAESCRWQTGDGAVPLQDRSLGAPWWVGFFAGGRYGGRQRSPY
jgi:hypothetical protein